MVNFIVCGAMVTALPACNAATTFQGLMYCTGS
jgi:hypothetical protein